MTDEHSRPSSARDRNTLRKDNNREVEREGKNEKREKRRRTMGNKTSQESDCEMSKWKCKKRRGRGAAIGRKDMRRHEGGLEIK